ncbi:GntR family transcriptional regulator [Streptomyces caeni]|uniref:GntR family transcriptional regulator n=1 Tax=Streptomyces caeni TaxID=2307231 RepID=A0ABW4IXZ7_9ACTN
MWSRTDSTRLRLATGRCGHSPHHPFRAPLPRPRDEPPYRRIATDPPGELRDGTIPPGERPPGERQLAAHFRVSRETVRRAPQILRHGGAGRHRPPEITDLVTEAQRRPPVYEFTLPAAG